MPALRQPVKRSPAWFLIAAAVALAIAAVFDWTRPPTRQVSTYAWEHGVVGAYRVAVRPVVKHFVRCRFYPTCSHYSVQAVQVHGFPRGLWLTMKRLVRCAPWTPMGTFDPVPPRNLPHTSVKSEASFSEGAL